MTETDATRRPLTMPEKFLPYLEKYRIYKLFKDMMRDLIVSLPKDHLKHMKIFLGRRLHCSKDADRIMLLISPVIKIDVKRLVKDIIKDLGAFVITRQYVMDCYEKILAALNFFANGSYQRNVGSSYLFNMSQPTFSKCLHEITDAINVAQILKKHIKFPVTIRERESIMSEFMEKFGFPGTIGCIDGTHVAIIRPIDHEETYFNRKNYHSLNVLIHDDYTPGCLSPVLMSEVTKKLTLKEPVVQVGWLMYDHPCTVREARCLQQDGVLPTVTLVLIPPPPTAPPTNNPLTPARAFMDQDFDGLKFAYKATLKEVYIDPDDDLERVSTKCFNAVRACAAGAQGSGQGHHVVGAPGVYRVLIIGARGSGRKTQAYNIAQRFGLVYLNFEDIFNEAKEKNDEIGERLRTFGTSIHVRAEIVKRRLLQRDCIDNGWVLTDYPTSGADFEQLDTSPTPPNRVIFLNADWKTCKTRAMARGVDWCTGRSVPFGSGPRTLQHPKDDEAIIDAALDYFFSEALAELRAAAGITAVEINALEPADQVQVKVEAAVISAPTFNIECCLPLRNVRAD